MRDVQFLLSLEHDEAIVELLSGLNFSIVVNQEIGRPKGSERDGGMAGWCSSQNIYIFQLSLPSYMGRVHRAPGQLQ